MHMGRVRILLSMLSFTKCFYAQGAKIPSSTNSCLTGTCRQDITDSSSLLQNKVQISDIGIDKSSDDLASDTPTPAPTPTQIQAFDTPGWINPRGHDCNSYAAKGWCANGAFASGMEWTGGAKYDYPEDNCVVCGKQACLGFSGRRRSSSPFTECPTGMAEDSYDAEVGCCLSCSMATSIEACNKPTCYTHVWSSGQCEALQCIQPMSSGYDFTGATGIFTPSEFAVKDVVCATGYTGTVVTTKCIAAGDAYQVDGCMKMCSTTADCPGGHDCDAGVCGGHIEALEAGDNLVVAEQPVVEDGDTEDESDHDVKHEDTSELFSKELSDLEVDDDHIEEDGAPDIYKYAQPGGLATRSIADFHKEISVLTVVCNYLDLPAFLTNETQVMADIFDDYGADRGERYFGKENALVGAGGVAQMLNRISNGRLSVSRSNVKIINITVPKMHANYEGSCPYWQYFADAKEAIAFQHPEIDMSRYTVREYLIPNDNWWETNKSKKTSTCRWGGTGRRGCFHPSMIPVDGRREFPPFDECISFLRFSDHHHRAHEWGHMLGLGHAGAEALTRTMMTSAGLPPPGVIGPTRRRGNPSKTGSNACRRRDNIAPDEEGWRCGVVSSGEFQGIGGPLTTMGVPLERPDFIAAERWQLGFLLTGSSEVVEWSVDDGDRTLKIQSLEQAPGVAGADAVAVRYRCPECVSKRKGRSQDGAYLWIDFHGGIAGDPYNCLYSGNPNDICGVQCSWGGFKARSCRRRQSSLFRSVKNIVAIHYVHPLSYDRRRTASRGAAKGSGHEYWGQLEIGQSYSTPCVQVDFEDMTDDIATVSLKHTC